MGDDTGGHVADGRPDVNGGLALLGYRFDEFVDEEGMGAAVAAVDFGGAADGAECVFDFGREGLAHLFGGERRTAFLVAPAAVFITALCAVDTESFAAAQADFAGFADAHG